MALDMMRDGRFGTLTGGIWTPTNAITYPAERANGASNPQVVRFGMQTGEIGNLLLLDYMPAEPGRTYRIRVRYRNPTDAAIGLRVFRGAWPGYDTSGESLTALAANAAHTIVDRYIRMPIDGYFFNLVFTGANSGTSEKYAFIDWITVEDVTNPPATAIPLAITHGEDTPANATTYSDPVWVGGARELTCALSVSVLTGTSPTVAYTIQSQDEYTGAWFDIVAFTTATGATTERRLVTAGIGRFIRLKRVIGGTATTRIDAIIAAAVG